MPSSLPTVSIAIPTYNESGNIESVINGFIDQKYPFLLEILVADGGSTDKTQKIVESLAKQHPEVKLMANPGRIQSLALNLMLKEASGEIFLRADAHSVYSSTYIKECVAALRSSESVNVGGAQRFVAKRPFQLGVCLASRSILGTGGANYRDPSYDGYSDTVYLGCFWKKTLQEIGGYDTTQLTNEDAELNQKLLESNDKAIYISSKIHVDYFPRATWKSLWKQYFKYGRGRYLTGTKHKKDSQLRGKLPFIAISLFIFVLLLSVVLPALRPFTLALTFLCLSLLLLESVRVFFNQRERFIVESWKGSNENIPPAFVICFYSASALLTMPLAHFSGFSYQMIRRSIFGVKDW